VLTEPIIKCISPYLVTFIKEDMTFSELSGSRGAAGGGCMSCETELWQRHCQITAYPAFWFCLVQSTGASAVDDSISFLVALTQSTYDKTL
jgi:hypothetical protein